MLACMLLSDDCNAHTLLRCSSVAAQLLLRSILYHTRPVRAWGGPCFCCAATCGDDVIVLTILPQQHSPGRTCSAARSLPDMAASKDSLCSTSFCSVTTCEMPTDPVSTGRTWPVMGSVTCCTWLLKLTRRPPKPKQTPEGRRSQAGGFFRGFTSPAEAKVSEC